MNTIKSLFFAIILLLLSAGSYAQYDNDNDVNKNAKIEKNNVNKGKPMRANDMKLTDQQKSDIKKIRLNSQKIIMPLRYLLVEKRAHLKTLTVAEKVNMTEIDKTIDEISGLTSQIMKQRESAKQEIRKLLTDEQRMIFDTRPPFRPNAHKRNIKEFQE